MFSSVYILISGLYLDVYDFGKICDWKLETGNWKFGCS